MALTGKISPLPAIIFTGYMFKKIGRGICDNGHNVELTADLNGQRNAMQTRQRFIDCLKIQFDDTLAFFP